MRVLLFAFLKYYGSLVVQNHLNCLRSNRPDHITSVLLYGKAFNQVDWYFLLKEAFTNGSKEQFPANFR